MKPSTRILMATGALRFLVGGLLLAGVFQHWLVLPLLLVWMRWSRPLVRRYLLPLIFHYVLCLNCRNYIALKQRWGKAGGGSNDYKERHACAWHSRNGGEEIGWFNCPTTDCGATIELQKSIDAKVVAGVFLGDTYHYSSGERRPSRLLQFRRQFRFWSDRPDSQSIHLGDEVQVVPMSLAVRLIRRLCKLKRERSVYAKPEDIDRHMFIVCTLGENIQNEHSGIEILGVIVA